MITIIAMKWVVFLLLQTWMSVNWEPTTVTRKMESVPTLRHRSNAHARQVTLVTAKHAKVGIVFVEYASHTVDVASVLINKCRIGQ
jgi:hypothetical protein